MRGLKADEKFVRLSVLIFILLAGLCFRLIFINKPEGLWNDEYVSWMISSVPFGKEFFRQISYQCHMPFYYFYLKFFMLFSGSDLFLRLTSVIPGVLSIIAMYFVGKELEDEKLGIFSAAVCSFSSFLIYFSQEVRFYSVLFLFSALTLLFTLKFLKKQNFLNGFWFIISNSLIVLTHSIGFVFVFFNLAFVSYELSKKSERYKKNIGFAWVLVLVLALLSLPLVVKMFTMHPYSQWWSSFSFSKLIFLITDYFSPFLTNIVSAPSDFLKFLSFKFILWGILPSIIAVLGIVNALKLKKRENVGIFIVSILYLTVLTLASMFGKLVFLSKYAIEVYPVLIVLMCFGLLKFGKVWRSILIFAFCFLNLFYLLSNENSAPRMHRSEGHKLVSELLNNAGLKKNDLIILNYYDKDRFERYFDFKDYKVISFNKNNIWQLLGIAPKADFDVNSKFFEQNLDKELNSVEQNQKVAIVILKDVAIYSPVKLNAIFQDEREYKKTPFFFVAFSYLRNKTLDVCLQKFSILRVEQKGSWLVITFSNNR